MCVEERDPNVALCNYLFATDTLATDTTMSGDKPADIDTTILSFGTTQILVSYTAIFTPIVCAQSIPFTNKH